MMGSKRMVSSPAARPSLWLVRIAAVLWFILGLGFLMSLPFLVSWGWRSLAAVILLSLIIALVTAWIVGRISMRQRSRVLRNTLVWTIAWTFLLSTVIGEPIYYLATVLETSPALVPQITLSNGTKTVIFQGMQHIGSETFYKGIIYDLEKALADGYVLYYEGFQSSPGEGDAWLAKYMTGGTDLSTTYKSLAESCGLTFQLDYFALMEEDRKLRPDRHVTVDVSTLDMKHEFDRLMRADQRFAAKIGSIKDGKSGIQADNQFVKSLVEWQQRGTDGQKQIAGIICRGVMTLASSDSYGKKEASPLEPVILDYRNRVLADRIAEEKSAKIYVTYGAAHIPGVITELRTSDPNWKVISEKWIRTIEAPRHDQGKNIL